MEPDCRITVRIKPKEKATDRFLILALMGVPPLSCQFAVRGDAHLQPGDWKLHNRADIDDLQWDDKCEFPLHDGWNRTDERFTRLQRTNHNLIHRDRSGDRHRLRISQ
jgi:hypothetical protein